MNEKEFTALVAPLIKRAADDGTPLAVYVETEGHVIGRARNMDVVFTLTIIEGLIKGQKASLGEKVADVNLLPATKLAGN